MSFTPELERTKALTPEQAAKILSTAANWSFSNLQINKILFLSQMTYMYQTGGKPLISGLFQAWDYGPVLPSIYHALKCFGSNPVRNIFRTVSTGSATHEQRHILEQAAKRFRNTSPGYLVRVTHMPDGAWAKNYDQTSRYVSIPNSDIFEEAQLRYGPTKRARPARPV